MADRLGLTLEAELEGALIDATGGETYGPLLARRLERVARSVLLRRGLGRARVIAESTAKGTSVVVLLPPGPSRVRQLVIRLDQASASFF